MIANCLVHQPSTVDTSLILLHGYGSNAADMFGLKSVLQSDFPNMAIVAANAPEPMPYVDNGHQWFDLPDLSPPVLKRGVGKYLDYINEIVIQTKATTGAKHIVMLGFSQGGMVALEYLLSGAAANKLAGVIGCSTTYVNRDQSLDLEANSLPPLALVHGAMDDVVPVSEYEQSLAYLKSKKISVKTHLAPSAGHFFDDTMILFIKSFLKTIG